ncbi:uncharacterized protein LOC100845964 isoform X2 [Brachypodium distachyon]|uniref:DUF4220 domain-containing protein n=2 Tax=Brachypodium distachyon TaxID=15368 RepID=I1H587_BRADI|nr:uncharacterized protein LOC100845964 isoform X2 [Brachypodium distachyon]KQK21594.1 hypothetical protein BRADI_1g61790v3 [Brachypodium distachyon]|eukprot:XP_003561613.1 uncharacterized protein LOC100845964 isoform X2 [Brachypodium distachyon]
MKYKKGDGADQPNDDGGMNGSRDAPPSIELDIIQHHGGGGGGLGSGGGGSTSFFEPTWREDTPVSGGSGQGCSSGRRGGREPPEKRLTLFALRLAVLEKAASGLGTLAFAWATVVLLGGFASDLTNTDFWCVTVILVGEGARVFSRSHELEWQHHATLTSTAGGALRSSSRVIRRFVHALAAPDDTRARAAQFQRQVVLLMKQRTWHAPDVSLLPYTGWVFLSKRIGRVLNWLQVLSASACVALSVMRLWKHDYFGAGAENKKDNMRPALLLFYTVALVEASLFLLEKLYWIWKVSVCKLLDQVSADCDLGAYGLVSLKRFFYDAYSRCISGSIFDGIKMDLVTFAEELILSDFLDEQLIGVRILQRFANSKSGSAGDTLRKVGTNPRSIERVVEMLNWKRPEEEEVRWCAAEVVSKLAGKRQNALRVSGIPGAIESVMSLLYTGRGAPASAGDPQALAAGAHGRSYDYLQFNLLGLRILKKLSRDHDNCGKIGNARGLLARIIGFTHASQPLLRNPLAPDSQVRAVKRALQVVKMLVYTTGATGKALRRDVAENVFTVSNLRGILQHGQQHMDLQKLAMDILTGLAMDDRAKEMIVSTGGVVKLLLSIFAVNVNADECELGREAAETLAMLALESEAGCSAILKRDDVLDQLVSALDDKDVRSLNAARVLRSLCAYSGDEHRTRLSAVTKAMPAVLRGTMTGSDKTLEVCVGLTTQICRFIDGERFADELRAAGLDERAYVERLVSILRQYRYPEIRVPRMRRFLVQQAVWLVTSSSSALYAGLLRELGMERLLESVADTTSELECYHVFSGSVAIGKHRENFSAIVESALQLISGGDAAAAAAGGSWTE